MKKIIIICIFYLSATLILLSPIESFAQDSMTKDDFLGLGFGVGVSLTWDRSGEKDRVESAKVVNGIVRVDNENNRHCRRVGT